MPSSVLPIPWPIGGLNDDLATIAQPPRTTREAVNVRGRDPKTGRVRGGVREGTTKVITALVAPGGATNKEIRDLASIMYESRRTTYTAITSAGDIVKEWSDTPDSGVEVQRIAVDRYSNIYGINDLARVTKWNSAGEQLLTFQVPVGHSTTRLRTIAVDYNLAVYVGSSTGPQGGESRIWKYIRDENDNYVLDWEIVLEGYCPDLKIRDGSLYALENRSLLSIPDGTPSFLFGTAHVNVYDELDSSAARLLWSRAVPFPAAQVRVNSSGEIFVTSQPNSERGQAQEQFDCSNPSVYDDPSDFIASWSTRKWVWLDARDLTGFTEGDEITFWIDKTGNGRNVFYWSGNDPIFEGISPPLFNPAGLCGKATVRFDGAHGLATADTSGGNAENNLDSNLSLMPTVQDQAFFIAMLICPSMGTGATGCVMEQFGEAKYRVIAEEGDEWHTGLTEPGWMRLAAMPVTDGSHVGSGQPGAAQYHQPAITTLRNDLALIVFRMDGDDVATSKYRLNGTAIDTFTVRMDQIRYQTQLGFAIQPGLPSNATQPTPFEGDIAEILTVRHAGTASGTIDTEIEQVEGYLAHKWGIQHMLPGGHAYRWASPGAPSGPSAVSGPESGGDELTNTINSVNGIIVKYAPNNGETVWAFEGAGVGYGVALGPTGDVYTHGPSFVTPSGGSSGSVGEEVHATVRKLTDNGASFTHAWFIGNEQIPDIDYWTVAEVDEQGNMYLPHHRTLAPLGNRKTLFKIDTSGAIELEYDLPSFDVAYDVKFDPKVPDYNNDNIKEPEFLYLAAFTVNQSLHKLRIVSAVQAAGSLRSRRLIATVDGTVRLIDPGAGTVVTPSGGASALDTTASWVQSAVLFGHAFIVDGENMVVYKAADNEVVVYKPTSPGESPRRPKLIANWRGRLVTARFDGDPHNWFMAAYGEPYNVDLAPAVIKATTAVIGNSSRAGLSPDIINTIIPYNDDLCFFGGDHSIQRMTGDPMAGGVFDEVTSITGMAFGMPWTKDDQGFLYFWGSKGGVYIMDPTGFPVSISDAAIEDRMRSVNMGTYSVRMAWNWRQQGLDIFFVPIGTSPGASLTHFFWERRDRAWYETEFSNTGHEPTALLTFDGDDPDDRVTLIGCADGYVRQWDKDAKDDDGTAIDARILLGPFMRGLRLNGRWSGAEFVLASDQDGCGYELMAANTPEDPPAVGDVSGQLTAGRNERIPHRVKGQAVWIRLRSASVGQRWAYESGSIKLASAGRVRL